MVPRTFFEVRDRKGGAVWGGTSANEALQWFRRGLNNSIYISIWDEEDPENPKPITDNIEATALVLAAISSEKDRG